MQKSDSTITEVLALVLERVAGILMHRGVPMPHHIQLQLDNTSHENKNLTVIRFLTYLSEVYISTGVRFFMVGHTHTDVDQRFSVLGPIIAGAQELETHQDFAALIRNRYTPLAGHELHVQVLEAVRHWKTWLSNFGEELGGHAGKGSAHAFKILRYKNLDPSWNHLTFESKQGTGHPQPDDKLLVVKGFMRDIVPLQNPLVIEHGSPARLDPEDLAVQDLKAAGKEVDEYRQNMEAIVCYLR